MVRCVIMHYKAFEHGLDDYLNGYLRYGVMKATKPYFQPIYRRYKRWKYQFPVFVYDDQDRPRVWTPDFYIPKLGIYIEVCGSKKFNYEYRRKIYEKNEFPVIFIHYYKERKKWKNFLLKSIEEIEALRHSEIMKMKT